MLLTEHRLHPSLAIHGCMTMARNSSQSRSDQRSERDENDDHDVENDSQSRFSAANLIRFAAVALFVVLGTFAVIHSMNSNPAKKGDGDQAQGLVTMALAKNFPSSNDNKAQSEPDSKANWLRTTQAQTACLPTKTRIRLQHRRAME